MKNVERSLENCEKDLRFNPLTGCYTFKKRREKAGRVAFTCNGCSKFNHYLPVMAWRERLDSDAEHDEYVLDVSIPFPLMMITSVAPLVWRTW